MTFAGGRAVAVATVVLAAVCLGYVFRYGPDCPFADEWDLSMAVVGEVPVAEVVLHPHNQHRYPLGQLAWVGLTRAAGTDFRAGMVANVLAAAGLAVLFARAAVVGSGRVRPADLLFPALFLNLGHSENWLMGYQLVLLGPLTAAGGLAVVVAGWRPGGEVRAGLAAGGLLLVVANGGAYGLAFVPPVAGWVLYLAGRLATRGRWAAGLGVAVPAVAAAGYLAFCLLTPGPAADPPAARPAGDLLRVWLQVIGQSLGHGVGGRLWPWAGWAVATATAVAAVRSAVAAVTDPQRRPTALGLLALLAPMPAAAAGVALVRGDGLAERYALPSAYHAAVVVLAFRVFPVRTGRAVGVAAVVAAVVVVAASWGPGVEYGRRHRYEFKALREDIRAGVPVGRLADRHAARLFAPGPAGRDRWAGRADALRRRQVGWFAAAAP